MTLYHKIKSIDNLALILPSEPGKFLNLNFNPSGEPLFEYSLIGCLSRKLIEKGKTFVWKNEETNLEGMFNGNLEALILSIIK